MRVLETASINSTDGLQFVDLNPNAIQPYAILSHTWSSDEILYSDIINATAPSRGAYPKVRNVCDQALQDGYDYVGIDTCCIDKSSSAEMSEAVNSMYSWYQRAAVCYTFLADCDDKGNLAQCRWFTRGFTLQELIAPRHVFFYSANWTKIGDKVDLRQELSEITHISEGILTGDRPIETTSIANRMGWAAHRATSRPEDMAYCLMGIFRSICLFSTARATGPSRVCRRKS